MFNTIYLYPSSELQGVHDFIDLSTAEAGTHPNIYPCVTKRFTVDRVEEIEAKQGIKPIKLSNMERK